MIQLFLEWLLIEADHERAIRNDDWNVLHVEEAGWTARATGLGWRDPTVVEDAALLVWLSEHPITYP